MLKLKEILRKILNYLLDMNFLILILTLIIFIITFFSSKGILFQVLYLQKQKQIINKNIKEVENIISNLNMKIKLLKEKNKEITEIENYKFKKKIPYEKYEIIKVE